MRLYFSFSQIPELQGLNRQRQRAVYRCAYEALLTDHPDFLWSSTRWMFGAIVIGLVGGWFVVPGGSSTSWKVLSTVAGGLMAIVLTALIGGHLLHARMRPYLQRVLEERQEEIASIQ